MPQYVIQTKNWISIANYIFSGLSFLGDIYYYVFIFFSFVGGIFFIKNGAFQ